MSSPNSMSLPQETGLAFISLYSSPTPRPLVRQQELSLEQDFFTGDEVALFERRFEEGYDLDFDHRYNSWQGRFQMRVSILSMQ